MNLRNTVRQLSQRSSAGFNINQPVAIIIIGVLFLLAGFTIVRFLLNFSQLQRVAEESSSTTVGEAPRSTEASGTEAVVSPGVAPIPVSAEPAEVAAWLFPLNRYRAMVGLAPVMADAQLSRGDLLHSHYLAVNYASELPDLRLGAEANTEDPAKPGFSAEGAAAAQASDVDWTWGPHS